MISNNCKDLVVSTSVSLQATWGAAKITKHHNVNSTEHKPCRLWLCSLLRCLSDERLREREWDLLLCFVCFDLLLLSRSLDPPRELKLTYQNYSDKHISHTTTLVHYTLDKKDSDDTESPAERKQRYAVPPILITWKILKPKNYKTKARFGCRN